MDVQLKRAYDPATPTDGYRVLVDRLWPRGVSRERVRLDAWEKDLAPSPELRQWFGHAPERFDEFRGRYVDELRGHRPLLAALRRRAREGTLTLVYSAHDREHNDAVVLAEVLRRGLTASAEDDLMGLERWVNEGGRVAPEAVLEREHGHFELVA